MSNLIRGIRGEFHLARQALEEHLNSINENTTEIQALFDYLQEMEVKVEKMSQRLDNLQLGMGFNLEKPQIMPLNQTERKVFLVLYTEEQPLSYVEIAQKAQLTNSLIPECLSSLMSKGVPVQRNFCNGQLFVKLDPAFKEMQAKEGLINLSLESFMVKS